VPGKKKKLVSPPIADAFAADHTYKQKKEEEGGGKRKKENGWYLHCSYSCCHYWFSTHTTTGSDSGIKPCTLMMQTKCSEKCEMAR
jgi:hypothetical protein